MSSKDLKQLPGGELLKLASQVVQQEKHEEAIQYFDEIIRRSKDQPYPYLSRATCNHQLKNYPEVIKDCQTILSFKDQKVEESIVKGSTTLHSVAYALLNNSYKGLNQLEKASESLTKRAEIEKQVQKDKPKDKVKLDRASLSKVEKLKTIAKKHFSIKNWQECKANYLELSQIDEDDKVVHSNLSLLSWKLNQFEEALFHANECIRIDGSWYKGYYRQGQALLGLELYEEAQKVLQEGYKLNEKDELMLTSLTRARTPTQFSKLLLEDLAQPLMFVLVAVGTAVYLDVIDFSEIKQLFYN